MNLQEPDCRKCGEPGSWYSCTGVRIRTRAASFKALLPGEQRERLVGAIPLCRTHAALRDWTEGPTGNGEARVCTECEQERPTDQFHKRGHGYHPWCKSCCATYSATKTKDRAEKTVRTNPALDASFWDDKPHGALMKELESLTGKCVALMGAAARKKNKAIWHAYYDTGRKRDEVREKVLELLKQLK